MKFPSEAVLHFAIGPDPGGSRLEQRALLRLQGLAGVGDARLELLEPVQNHLELAGLVVEVDPQEPLAAGG